MNDAFTQRVRLAGVAAWWTVLVGVIWMTAAWLGSMLMLSLQPEWFLRLWGGGMDWKEVHAVMVRFLAGFKLIFFVCVLAAIWLTLWARKLKRLGGS